MFIACAMPFAVIPTAASAQIVTRLVLPGGNVSSVTIAPGDSITFEVRIDAPTVSPVGAAFRLSQTSPANSGLFRITARSNTGSPFNDPQGGATDGAILSSPANLLQPDSALNLGNNSVGMIGVNPGSNLLLTTLTLTSDPATLSGTYRIQPTPGVSLVTETTSDALGNDVAMSDAYFDVVVVRTVPGVPGAPVIGTAVAGDRQISVAFAAPGSDGGSPLIGYTATCGGQNTNGTSSPIIVTGLVNGTSYVCTVSAINAIGVGPPSAPSNAVTPFAFFAISTTASPSAGGTVSCSPNPVIQGNSSTCTATANVSYTFSGFSGDCTGTTCTFSNVSSAKSVTATFTILVSLDVDLSAEPTKYHALTDGQLVLRYMLGLTGSALTAGALGPTANRSDPGDISTYLTAIRSRLDVDGNTVVDVATDGLLILRYMLGFRGDALIAGAIGSTPTRSSAQDIEAWLANLMP
jgi:large repetitive protein